MLGTKPLWNFGQNTLLSGKQWASADVDQGRRPEAIKVQGDTRQSERHILVPADQTTLEPGTMQATVARLIWRENPWPVEMAITSSLPTLTEDTRNGDAAQALTSVAVPSGMIPEEDCAQSKIGLENGDGDAIAISDCV